MVIKLLWLYCAFKDCLSFSTFEKQAISLLEKSLLKTFQITKYQVKMLFSNVDTGNDMLRVRYTHECGEYYARCDWSLAMILFRASPYGPGFRDLASPLNPL